MAILSFGNSTVTGLFAAQSAKRENVSMPGNAGWGIKTGDRNCASSSLRVENMVKK